MLTAKQITTLLESQDWHTAKVEGYNNHKGCEALYVHDNIPGVEFHVHNRFNGRAQSWVNILFRFPNGAKPSYVVSLFDAHTEVALLAHLGTLTSAMSGNTFRKNAAYARKTFGIR